MGTNGSPERETAPIALRVDPLVDQHGVPIGRLVIPEDLRFKRIRDYAGYKVESLKSALRGLEQQADCETWADLAQFMMRVDPHLKGAVETRLLAVAGADYTIEPGQTREGDERARSIAEAGAKFCERSLGLAQGLQDTFGEFLAAGVIGWAVGEAPWSRIQGEWHRTKVYPTDPRDVGFANDRSVIVRTYPTKSSRESWLRIADEDPRRFIVHTGSAIGELPHLSGDLLAVAWPWFWKRWANVFRMEGLERMADPKLIGILEENAPDEARTALFDGLKNMSSQHFGVVRGATRIEVLQVTGTGEAWDRAITSYNADISKGILGSTLNVEIDHAGGNRAAAESQAATTILPRLKSDRDRLAQMIKDQWFRPLLELNAHLFGCVPPVPEIKFQLEAEDPPEVTELVVKVGAATVDEVREGAGLNQWGDARGDAIAKLPEAQPEGFFSRAEPAETPPGKARRRQSSRRTSKPTRASTQQTFSDWGPPIANVPWPRSDGSEK